MKSLEKRYKSCVVNYVGFRTINFGETIQTVVMPNIGLVKEITFRCI